MVLNEKITAFLTDSVHHRVVLFLPWYNFLKPNLVAAADSSISLFVF